MKCGNCGTENPNENNFCMNCKFTIWYPAPKSCSPEELGKLMKEGWRQSNDIFDELFKHPAVKDRMTLLLEKRRKDGSWDEDEKFQKAIQEIKRGIEEYFLVNCDSAMLDEKYELDTSHHVLLYVRPGIFFNVKKSLFETIFVGVPITISFYFDIITKGTPLAEITGSGISLIAFARIIATHYTKLASDSEKNVYNSIHKLTVKFREEKQKLKFPTSTDITKDLMPKMKKNQVIKELWNLKSKGIINEVNKDRWKISS